MHSEFWFSDLTKSLKHGFFADRVVLELARVSKDLQVTEEQTQVFAKAADMLELAQKGHSWLDDPKISEKSSSYVTSYSQAVDAMSITVTSGSFMAAIQNLLQIAKDLAAKQMPNENEILALRTFFFNASRSELERTEELFGGDKDAGRSSLLWMTATNSFR